MSLGDWLWVVLLVASLLVPPGLHAQQGKQGWGDVLLEPNEPIFAVLTALNMAGYDTGLGVNSGNDVRSEVRGYLAQGNVPDLAVIAKLRRFYVVQQQNDPAKDLGQYLSLALLLGPPPELKLTVDERDIPPDVRDIAAILPLVRTFYEQAEVGGLWQRLQGRYNDEVQRYSAPVRRSVELSDAYLRFPSGSYLGRTYAIYLCLMAAPNQVQARIYGANYYLVVTPSKELQLGKIRHQYLHFLLDGLALKYAAEIEQKTALLGIARKAPALSPDYRQDFSLLLTECLIGAVELRMDKVPAAEAQKRTSAYAASGLILVPYFYDALVEFEKQESSMNVYYKQMVLGIDPDDESDRLAKIKFAPAPAPEAVTEAANKETSPLDRQLDDADDLIYQGKYLEAKAAYAEIISKSDPKNQRALFGMAMAYSNLRKPDLAVEYFQKTLDVARDLRILTWSHIYLGRIDDIEDNRKAALEQYRAASLTAGAFPEALRAVQAAQQKPFGSK